MRRSRTGVSCIDPRKNRLCELAAIQVAGAVPTLRCAKNDAPKISKVFWNGTSNFNRHRLDLYLSHGAHSSADLESRLPTFDRRKKGLRTIRVSSVAGDIIEDFTSQKLPRNFWCLTKYRLLQKKKLF